MVLSKSYEDKKETMAHKCNLQKESYFMDTNAGMNEKGGFRNLGYYATYQQYKKSDKASPKQTC